MVPDDLDPLDADEPARVLARAAADAGDEQVAPGQPGELRPGPFGHSRELRPRRDRRERPVDVEDERASLGRVREGGEELRGLHRPA